MLEDMLLMMDSMLRIGELVATMDWKRLAMWLGVAPLWWACLEEEEWGVFERDLLGELVNAGEREPPLGDLAGDSSEVSDCGCGYFFGFVGFLPCFLWAGFCSAGCCGWRVAGEEQLERGLNGEESGESEEEEVEQRWVIAI